MTVIALDRTNARSSGTITATVCIEVSTPTRRRISEYRAACNCVRCKFAGSRYFRAAYARAECARRNPSGSGSIIRDLITTLYGAFRRLCARATQFRGGPHDGDSGAIPRVRAGLRADVRRRRLVAPDAVLQAERGLRRDGRDAVHAHGTGGDLPWHEEVARQLRSQVRRAPRRDGCAAGGRGRYADARLARHVRASGRAAAAAARPFGRPLRW